MDVGALGSLPIPGENPAGFDAKYEPEYEAVVAEIDKLSSASRSTPISWSRIAEQSRIILESKSKDILIAVYMGVALQKTEGIQGLFDAVRLFLALFSSCWETAFPPLNRLRKRTNAFEWWHERAYAAVQAAGGKPPIPAALLNDLLDALEQLDQLSGELMPDALPLRDLREAVRRLPSLPPEPVVEAPPAQAETTPATPAPAPPPGPAPSPAAPAAPPTAAPAAPAVAPAAPAAPPPTSVAAAPTESENDDLAAALRTFSDAARRYAFLAHKKDPGDPLPWQLLRLAIWGKVTALPPSENGQSHVPPPDSDRLEALRNLLRSGKALEAALGAENFFAASLFCLDAQAIIDEALTSLGPDYAQARERVREECLRFVRRLEGVETLAFADGTPFAGMETREWLRDLAEESGSSNAANAAAPNAADAADAAVAAAIAEAETLFADKRLGEALARLEKAEGSSGLVNMSLRLEQLRLLRQAGETQTAATLARALLDEATRRDLEHWDRAMTVAVLAAVRDALALARDKDGANAVQERLARLCPSAAIGWRQTNH